MMIKYYKPTEKKTHTWLTLFQVYLRFFVGCQYLSLSHNSLQAKEKRGDFRFQGALLQSLKANVTKSDPSHCY